MSSRWSLLWLVLLLASPLIADEYTLTIRGGDSESATLVEIPLPEGADADRAWELVWSPETPLSESRQRTQPALGDRRKLLALVWPRDRERRLTLRAVPRDRVEPLPPVICGPHLVLLDSSRQILRYHFALSKPPMGIAEHYSRSGHIHPLMTPTGQVITSEFPADHPHQHGLFFAWVNTQFAGHKVDFWNQGAKLGTVRHKRLINSATGLVYSGFEAELEHVDLTSGETVVLNETWRVTAWAGTGSDQLQYHMVDLESRQVAATQAPLEIQKYHYGGFGWRGPEEWLLPKEGSPAKGCVFLTSLGDDRQKGNHTRPEWVAVTGEVNDELCTVAIFGSPRNFQHPQPVRLHPDKPYFCFAPCVLGEFSIRHDQPLISRYRIVTHAGAAVPKLYEGLVRQWKQPPVVEFEKE